MGIILCGARGAKIEDEAADLDDEQVRRLREGLAHGDGSRALAAVACVVGHGFVGGEGGGEEGGEGA